MSLCTAWVGDLGMHAAQLARQMEREDGTMRVTTIRTAWGTAAGRVEGNKIVQLPFADVGELLSSGSDWRERAEATDGIAVPVDEADFAPLVPRPEKIICVGANFRDHVAEVGLTLPEQLGCFSPSTAVASSAPTTRSSCPRSPTPWTGRWNWVW